MMAPLCYVASITEAMTLARRRQFLENGIAFPGNSMPHAEPLLLELCSIFVRAKVFEEIFERLGLPAVVGKFWLGSFSAHTPLGS